MSIVTNNFACPVPEGSGARPTPDPTIRNRERLAQIKSFGEDGAMDVDYYKEAPHGTGRWRMTAEIKTASNLNAAATKNEGEDVSGGHLTQDLSHRGGIGCHAIVVHNSDANQDVDVKQCLVAAFYLSLPKNTDPVQLQKKQLPAGVSPEVLEHLDDLDYLPLSSLSWDQLHGRDPIAIRHGNNAPYTLGELERMILVLADALPDDPNRAYDWVHPRKKGGRR